MKATLSTLAVAGLLAVTGAASAAPNFSGVTFFDGQFLNVDGSAGAATQAGMLGAGVTPDGLAAANGSLYTFDTTASALLQLNPLTGATVASYLVSLPVAPAPDGLAILGGNVYLAEASANSTAAAPSTTLYTFGLTGGTATAVGGGTVNDLFSALAFGPGGTLYGLGKGDGQLYTIDRASGAGTLVGGLGSQTVPDPLAPGGSDTFPIGGSPLGALAFSGNTLYAAADDNLYTVSTTDGSATPVAPALYNTGLGGGFSSVSGLAPAATPAVPESSSVLLLGAGLLPALFVLRRRKA